jgi:hypothetical protein
VDSSLGSDSWSSAKKKKVTKISSSRRQSTSTVPPVAETERQSAKAQGQVIAGRCVKPAKLDALLHKKFPGGDYKVEVGTLWPLFAFSQLIFPQDAIQQMDGIRWQHVD